MKLRNLANKFLLVMLLAVLTLGNYAFNLTAVWVGTPTNLTTAAAVSSKTYYLDQLNDNQPTGETLYEALGITVYNDYLTALSATQDLNEVAIAVVDTGLDCTSPVFTDRILSDYAVDFSCGIPAAADNTWYVDKNGHGTHVAGIIADATPANVKILPIKIFDGVNNSVNDGAALENAIRWLC
ncbi:MAG: S8 family serine peptidase, partial [Clostridia bacterium]|nr:S8 family serine peptidase [Clostridia bacterium]